MISNYEQAIELLTSTSRFRIELGLERIKHILSLLGNPERNFKIIHIAGTNGKGSVCAITAKILECAGYKTALYTSPHLVDYTERIKVNSLDISRDDFAHYIFQIVELANKNDISLTEFEILTAVAFKYFSDQNVDYAVVETGLGGRFDATNAVEKKEISVITSISIDHKDILGDTIEKIAYEKAGIIKHKTPVVISSDNMGFEVVKKQAEALNSPVLLPSQKVDISFENGINYAIVQGERFEFPLLGLFQKENLELVFEIVKYLFSENQNPTDQPSPQPSPIGEGEQLGKFIKEGLKNVVWHSRFQFIKDKNLIIDGAHNEGAARVLRESLDFYFPSQNRTFIFGAMNTKEYKKVAKILFRPEDKVYFYQFKDKRAISFEEFKVCWTNAKEVSEEEIKNIMEMKESSTIKIACGSFYVAGKVIEVL